MADLASYPHIDVKMNLLETMLVGIAGRKHRGSIWAVHGKKGHVAYGPYCRLTSGKSHLRVDVQFGAAVTGPSSALYVEALYGDIVLGLASIPALELQASMDMVLNVPETWAPLLREPKFEVRISSHGDVDAKLVNATLTKLDQLQESSWQIPGNWLPLMSVGSAGKHISNRIELLQEAAGIVFYGPYRSLLPGDYRLRIHHSDASRSTSGQDKLFLEVLLGPKRRIASKKFALRNGSTLLEIQFKMPQAAVYSEVPREVEFRLFKKGQLSATIDTIELEVLSSS